MPLYSYLCEPCDHETTALYSILGKEPRPDEIPCEKCGKPAQKMWPNISIVFGGSSGKQRTHDLIKKRNLDHFVRKERYDIAEHHGTLFNREGNFAGFVKPRKRKRPRKIT